MSFIFALLFVVRSHAQIQTLPKLKIDRSTITVSGISSGAFMAVQLGVVFSSQVKGVASVAGGPFGCAGGDTQTAIGVCMGNPSRIQLETLVAEQMKLNHLTEKEVLESVFLKQQYLKKLTSPDQVADFVMYLASDAASTITGEAFNISGGWGMGL